MPEHAPAGAPPTAASMAAVSKAVDAAASDPKLLLVLNLVAASGHSSTNVGLPSDVSLAARNRLVATAAALAAAVESRRVAPAAAVAPAPAAAAPAAPVTPAAAAAQEIPDAGDALALGGGDGGSDSRHSIIGGETEEAHSTHPPLRREDGPSIAMPEAAYDEAAASAAESEEPLAAEAPAAASGSGPKRKATGPPSRPNTKRPAVASPTRDVSAPTAAAAAAADDAADADDANCSHCGLSHAASDCPHIY